MKKYRIEVFRNPRKEWCWRVMHRNGREIARASETYSNKGSMTRALGRMLRGFREEDFSVERA